MQPVSQIRSGLHTPVCVAGLCLSPEHAQLVVLSGDEKSPLEVLCAEHLPMPPGLWQDDQWVDAQGLGQWLQAYLQSRDLAPQRVSFSVAASHLSWRTVTLPAELVNEDLAFQITAEMLDGRVQQADQICIDYVEMPRSATDWYDRQTSYRAVVTSSQWVKQCRLLARHGHMSVHVIEPQSQSEERIRAFQSFVQQSSVSAAGVLLCEQACGLALAYWDDDIAFNFYPLHLEISQRQQRSWTFRMVAGLMMGVVMSTGLTVLFDYSAKDVQQSLQDAYRITRSLDEVRRINVELQQQLDQRKSSTQSHDLSLDFSDMASQRQRGT
jgi:hypothetical protein